MIGDAGYNNKGENSCLAPCASRRYRLDFNERLRFVLLAVVWLSYTALSILMIIALLTDWPEILHREGSRLGPW